MTQPSPEPTPALPRLGFRAGPTVKIALIGLLLLLLLIPLELIRGVIEDRQQYQEEALTSFRAAWGPAQSVLAPVLVLPFMTGAADHRHREYLYVAASRLDVAARLSPEIRRRGLFHGVVFGAETELKGSFALPAELWSGQDVQWSEAYILLGASDLRALKPDATLDWGGRKLAMDAAGPHDSTSCGALALMIAHPDLTGPIAADATIPFDVTLDLRGTEALRIVPIARQIDVAMTGAWATPNFGGEAPPADYQVTDTGFTANWHAASNAATGRWNWRSYSRIDCANGGSAALRPEAQIGTELLEAVPTYRMVERASKYGVLFLALAFLTYFLFELVARIRIHIVQYGLLGLSVTLFALLLISFAEPLGFEAGYALSSAAVMAQASLFTASVTGRRGLALVFAAVLGGLFAFLYVVLSLESFALLAGAVAVFALLSAVMALTRKVDWSGGKLAPEVRP